MVATFGRFEATTRRRLGELSHWHRVVYALLVCRRFAPYYYEFVRVTGAGAPDALGQAAQALSAGVEGIPVEQMYLSELRSALEAAVPDTELIEAFGCAPEHILAQDAAIAHVSALGVLAGGAAYEVDEKRTWQDEVEHAWWLASACYDAADREASDYVLPQGGIYTPAVEQAVAKSPPVERELQWQDNVLRGLQLLANVPASAQLFVERHSLEPLIGRAPAA